MKKLLILAFLSLAFNAKADDQYLYWMLDDVNATVTLMDGTTKAISACGNPVFARIRAVDTGGSESYLTIYSSQEDVSGRQMQSIDPTCSTGLFAKFAGSSYASLWVELYNDLTVADSSWIGQAQLTWNDSMVVSSSMAVPENWALASSFTAAPEPTSGLLLLVGLAGLALRRRNKRA